MANSRKFSVGVFVLLLGIAAAAAGQSVNANLDSTALQDSASVVADTTSEVPQRDAMDLLDQYVLRKRPEEIKVESPPGLQWALLPTFSYNPVYGAAFGVLLSGTGRLGKEKSHYSTLSISGNYSTTGQVQVQVRGNVFSPKEDYLTMADLRYLDTERSTWGLGPLEDQTGEYPMTFVLYRVYVTALRRISGAVYVGIGFHLDHFDDIVDELAKEGESTPFAEYSGESVTQTRAIGLSANLLADTRDNLVNPKHGYYLSWIYRDYLKRLGSDENWQEFWIEARLYPHVPARSQNVLAFWLYGWLTFGKPPYLNLPANGWDTFGRGGRGYVPGRIRGSDQVYIEFEYRFGLTRDGLFGAVVFLNGMSTTEPETGIFSRLDHGIGFGLRIKFNKYTDTNLAIDYGWGQSSSNGLFLGMTEVF